MPKIPQVQFVKMFDQLCKERREEPMMVSSYDHFGKSWSITGAYDVSFSGGHYDRYRLSHYGTCILEVKVNNKADVDITFVEVTRASDRDGINSLLHILNADHRVTKNGALIPKRHLR